MNTKQTHKIKRNFLGILNLGMILLFCVALLAISCSKNDADVIEQQQEPPKTTFSQQDNPYKSIMDSLYGKGSYTIAEQAVKITDNSESDYYVKVVSTNHIDRGYLVNIDDNQDGQIQRTLFVDHNLDDTDKITYYDRANGIQQSFDLNKSPAYPEIGFHPTDPEPPLTTNNKFMGYEKHVTIEPLDPDNPGAGCYKTVSYQLYVFWIPVGDAVVDYDKSGIVPC